MALQQRLQKVFDYKKGFLYRKGSEKPSGWLDRDGYYLVYFEGSTHRANRLIWAYHNGETSLEIDHRNNDRDDNSIENLREATRQQNNQNRSIHADNKSGYKGVVENANGSFTAYIDIDGMTKNLGTFKTPKKASIEYQLKATEVHGEFKADK